jgi:uncharacterized damage-inducible protein DinB
MNMLQYFQRQFNYDDWANRETLASIKRSGQPAHALKLFAHIIAGEQLWLSRVRQDGQKIIVWPDLNISQCEIQLAQLPISWRDYLCALSDQDLTRQIAYTNSQGESWSSAIEDIIAHVIMHSVYHRGQVAADLRAAGFASAYTDFIHASRQGFIDE